MNRTDLIDFQSTYDFDESNFSELAEPLFVIGRTRRNVRPPRLPTAPKMEKVWHHITAEVESVPDFASETGGDVHGDQRSRVSHAAYRTNDSTRTHTIDLGGDRSLGTQHRPRPMPARLRVPAEMRTDYELAKAEVLDDELSNSVSETLMSASQNTMSTISTKPKSGRRGSYIYRTLEDFALESLETDHDISSPTDTASATKTTMSGIKVRNLACPLCGSVNGKVTESNLEYWATGAVNFDSDKNFKSFDVLLSYLENKEDLRGKQLDIDE